MEGVGTREVGTWYSQQWAHCRIPYAHNFTIRSKQCHGGWCQTLVLVVYLGVSFHDFIIDWTHRRFLSSWPKSVAVDLNATSEQICQNSNTMAVLNTLLCWVVLRRCLWRPTHNVCMRQIQEYDCWHHGTSLLRQNFRTWCQWLVIALAKFELLIKAILRSEIPDRVELN
jgi:hypothetical protein